MKGEKFHFEIYLFFIGEAIVSIRKLVQHDAERHSEVIQKLGRFYLKGKVTSSNAKCSIIWLIGEYNSLGRSTPVSSEFAGYACLAVRVRVRVDLKIFLVPKIAPDVLRISAKQFIGEDYNVKLQIMNLSAKMSLMENMSEQTKLAITYIFNLARYDQR